MDNPVLSLFKECVIPSGPMRPSLGFSDERFIPVGFPLYSVLIDALFAILLKPPWFFPQRGGVPLRLRSFFLPLQPVVLPLSDLLLPVDVADVRP